MLKEKMTQIINAIEAYDTIGIYRHVFPDPDSYGAQTALKHIIQTTYPHKKVYLFGEHNPALEYITRMDPKEDEALMNEACLAIIVDVSDSPRVDHQSFKQCGKVLKIDHHKPYEEPFEDITWVDTTYTSCCEMILDLLTKNEKKLRCDKKGREALFIGIMGDTRRLLYVSNPTELMKKLTYITFDLETKTIYEELYKVPASDLKFLGYIYNHFVIANHGMAYLKIPTQVLQQYGLEAITAARMVNALQECEGLVNWHFFAETPEGKVMCELRSRGPQVNDIASQYGGGGHFFAAGATLDGWERVDAMLKDLEENCRIYQTNK
ncbi:MAG: DHH family phosphoesterase [Cellulosilyticaceae bacterium]